MDDSMTAYEIRAVLCSKPGLRMASSFGRDVARERLEDLLEYTFGNSRISFTDYSRGPFGLMGFVAFADKQNYKFIDLVKKNHEILDLMVEIKKIYENKIIPQQLSEPEFIELHLKKLVKILDLDLPTLEFYKRAKILRDNLSETGETNVPDEILCPSLYKDKKKK
jgi:hypothetical protein